MGLLKQIFTWWDGATIGTSLHIRRHGSRVGTDENGNVYFASKRSRNLGNGAERRWVIYNGPNDASRIPPEWYSWLLHQIEGTPDEALPPAPRFLKESTGNRTGTPQAYLPSGALQRGGQRQAASGDYEAWTPGEG
jgi:NADH:ubiquinone oxidoreductase subunit